MTALIQPMGNGVIAVFKAHYLRRTFDQFLVATDGEDKPSIREYCRGYNILKATDNVAKAWEEVTKSCMNGEWRKLWPVCVQDFQRYKNVVPSVNRDTLNSAHKAGFRELESTNTEEALASHAQELANEDLKLLVKSSEEGCDDKDNVVASRTLALKCTSLAFSRIEEGLDILGEDDPNRERNSQVHQNVMESLRRYYELFKEKKKHTKQETLNAFFSRRKENRLCISQQEKKKMTPRQ
jgi:hypothetical protein